MKLKEYTRTGFSNNFNARLSPVVQVMHNLIEDQYLIYKGQCQVVPTSNFGRNSQRTFTLIIKPSESLTISSAVICTGFSLHFWPFHGHFLGNWEMQTVCERHFVVCLRKERSKNSRALSCNAFNTESTDYIVTFLSDTMSDKWVNKIKVPELSHNTLLLAKYIPFSEKGGELFQCMEGSIQEVNGWSLCSAVGTSGGAWAYHNLWPQLHTTDVNWRPEFGSHDSGKVRRLQVLHDHHGFVCKRAFAFDLDISFEWARLLKAVMSLLKVFCWK